MKKNKSIVEHVIHEFLGKGNLSQYELLVAKNVTIHCPPSWQKLHAPSVKGIKTVKQLDRAYSSALRMQKVTISDLLADQDKILARWSCEGIHAKDLFDIEASRRRFILTGQTLYRFNPKEQVAEVWQAWDMLGLLGQLQIPFNEDKVFQKAASLSARERDCLKYLLLGKTAKETGLLMKLSFRTVEYYFENIKDKLGCYSKRELIACAHLLEKHSYPLR